MIGTKSDDPGAWRSSDFRSADDYAVDLGARHVRALTDALAAVRRAGIATEDLTRDAFSLAAIADDVARWFDVLRHGRGFLMLRGFPVEGFPVEDIGTMYYGLGTHLGAATSQSVLGDRLGYVIDMSREKADARSYQNREPMLLHSDFTDILAMLSVRTARVGGLSRYCSALAVHDDIVERHPEYLEPLYRGFPLYLMGEHREGESPVTPFDVPVFSRCQGALSSLFVRGLITKAAAHAGRTLTDLETAAVDYFVETAHRPDVMLEFMMEPGEVVLADNLRMLHSRTAIENDPEGPRRLLLRLWLKVANGRPRVPEIDLYQTAGGIAPQAAKRPAYAETALAREVAR
ncbi:MAG: TauD/TfdA family dioxygenase [Alphaproteobacteria bacterium]|nr:TauD/TfdA family dioxygenase [Alphaproteobacteria bacterium]